VTLATTITHPEGPGGLQVAVFLLCESTTYGDRDHPTGSVADERADVINTVAKCGGAIVIPPSAVGRAQTIMYHLRELEQKQRIPHLPVYVDSRLEINVTGFYASHHEVHDLELPRQEQVGHGNPLSFSRSADDANGR
jgi:metallo-beta-lactamase family protein